RRPPAARSGAAPFPPSAWGRTALAMHRARRPLPESRGPCSLPFSFAARLGGVVAEVWHDVRADRFLGVAAAEHRVEEIREDRCRLLGVQGIDGPAHL